MPLSESTKAHLERLRFRRQIAEARQREDDGESFFPDHGDA